MDINRGIQEVAKKEIKKKIKIITSAVVSEDYIKQCSSKTNAMKYIKVVTITDNIQKQSILPLLIKIIDGNNKRYAKKEALLLSDDFLFKNKYLYRLKFKRIADTIVGNKSFT